MYRYELAVPDPPDPAGSVWQARSQVSFDARVPLTLDERASVEITNTSPRSGLLYACIRLTDADAITESYPFSLEVDRALISTLQPGDVVHICGTSCGGCAISILRDGELQAAAGAVCSVPLGLTVAARTPSDLVAAAHAAFRQVDAEFELHELPIEIAIGGARRLFSRARVHLNGYEIFVRHGFMPGLPGTDECLAIARIDRNLAIAANATACLLDRCQLIDEC